MGLFREDSPEEKKLKEITGGFVLSKDFLDRLKANGLATKEGVEIQGQIKQEIKEKTVTIDSIEERLNCLIIEEYNKNISNKSTIDTNSNGFKRKLLVSIGNFIAYYKIIQKLLIFLLITITILIALFYLNNSLYSTMLTYFKENFIGILAMIISLFVFAYTIDFKYWSDEKLKREKGIYLFYSIMVDILGLFPFRYNEGQIETEIDDINIAFDYFLSLHRNPNFIYLPTLGDINDNLYELIKEMQLFIVRSRSELYYVNKTGNEETEKKAQEKVKKDFFKIFNKFLELAYKNIGYLQFYDEHNRLTDYLEIYEGCIINEINKENNEK